MPGAEAPVAPVLGAPAHPVERAGAGTRAEVKSPDKVGDWSHGL